MLVLQHIDWFGPAEELKEWDEAMKKACAETDGIEYKGRYVPHTKKYHYTYLFKVENYGKVMEAFSKIQLTRDYSKMTHGEVEIYAET